MDIPLCVRVCTGVPICHSVQVEARGQPVGVSSLFLPCGAWRLNSGFCGFAH